MKLIRLLIADAAVALLVITIVKMAGHAGLGIGLVGKNGPVAGFELLVFQAGPQASGLGRTLLGIVVAFALLGTTASAVLELSLGVAQLSLVGVAHVLSAISGTTPVGVDDQAGSGPLGQ